MKDGQKICISCQESVFVDTPDYQAIHDDGLKEFGTLGLPLLETAPLVLVDTQALNDHSGR